MSGEKVEKAQLRKTPLYGEHLRAGGKIVDFHGWLLPIQYGSILREHENVRTAAGLFDVSHMGEMEVSGEDSAEFLQALLTNDIAAEPGKAVYSPMCYPDGGTVDDLIVYKRADGRYLLVVNASNTEKDYQWLLENKKSRVHIADRSGEFAQLALQGPKAEEILQKLVRADLGGLRNYRFINEIQADTIKIILSRTGYTGEDGFELYCSPESAPALWNMLLDAGSDYGLAPAGLGARDTLRLEAAMPLYGQELSPDISPVMAGLRRFVRPEKGKFTGREKLLEQLEKGPEQKLAGFEMLDRAVPRGGYEVYGGDIKVGYVTSGGYFPTLKKNMGLALLYTGFTAEDGKFDIKVRDGLFAARIVKLPFYRRQNK